MSTGQDFNPHVLERNLDWEWGFTPSPGNNPGDHFPPPDLHPHHGNPLASLESVTCQRQILCMECIAEPGLEPRPYKVHSPRLFEEHSTGGQIKWVEVLVGFWRMVRVRVELVRKSRIPTHPWGGAGFHSFLHMPPLLTWSPELPGPLSSCSRCREGSYVHLDRTLRLEFVRSWKEPGILGKAPLLSESHLLI